MLEIVVLPILIGLAILAVAAVWRGSSKERRRIALIGFGLVVDVWLWLVSTTGPLGPVPVLFIGLIAVHLFLALQVVTDLTGFSVSSSRDAHSVGRGRNRRSGRGSGYSGYHGD